MGPIRSHPQSRERRRHGPEVEDHCQERAEIAGCAYRAHRGHRRPHRRRTQGTQEPRLYRGYGRRAVRDRCGERRDRLGERVSHRRDEQVPGDVAVPEGPERDTHRGRGEEHAVRDIDRRPLVRPRSRDGQGKIPVPAVGPGLRQDLESESHRRRALHADFAAMRRHRVRRHLDRCLEPGEHRDPRVAVDPRVRGRHLGPRRTEHRQGRRDLRRNRRRPVQPRVAHFRQHDVPAGPGDAQASGLLHADELGIRLEA